MLSTSEMSLPSSCLSSASARSSFVRNLPTCDKSDTSRFYEGGGRTQKRDKILRSGRQRGRSKVALTIRSHDWGGNYLFEHDVNAQCQRIVLYPYNCRTLMQNSGRCQEKFSTKDEKMKAAYLRYHLPSGLIAFPMIGFLLELLYHSFPGGPVL